MRDLTGFRKGIVRIRVQGEQTERFLNLCKARKIKISSLDRTGEQSLEGDFGIQDFLRLSPIRIAPDAEWRPESVRKTSSGHGWRCVLLRCSCAILL